MNWDALMERLAEMFSQIDDSLEAIANELAKAKENAEALEWEREAWKASELDCFPGARCPFQGRIPAISVAAAMREHTAVTGK